MGQYKIALYILIGLIVVGFTGGWAWLSSISTKMEKLENLYNSDEIEILEGKMDSLDSKISYVRSDLTNIETKIDNVGASIDLIDSSDTYVTNNETTYISITQFQFFLILGISSLFGSIIGSLLSLRVITKFVLEKHKK